MLVELSVELFPMVLLSVEFMVELVEFIVELVEFIVELDPMSVPLVSLRPGVIPLPEPVELVALLRLAELLQLSTGAG